MTDSYHRVLARKTILSTLSGLRVALWQVTMLPPVLKTRPEGVLVAGMHRYFCTSWLTHGKFPSCIFHHSRGSISLSAFGVER